MAASQDGVGGRLAAAALSAGSRSPAGASSQDYAGSKPAMEENWQNLAGCWAQNSTPWTLGENKDGTVPTQSVPEPSATPRTHDTRFKIQRVQE